MTVFEKIEAQQPKERTAVWMVGEQLKDIIKNDPQAQEIVAQDLDTPELSIANCEKKIKAYADAHKAGGFACVIPAEAERIIREFYGLQQREQEEPTPAPPKENVIDLASFF